MLGLIVFVVCLGLLLFGFPVAFTFGGAAVVFGLIADPGMFAMMPHRIWAVMNNTILMAIPLFIFITTLSIRTEIA